MLSLRGGRNRPAATATLLLVAFALALPALWNRFPKFKLINNY